MPGMPVFLLLLAQCPPVCFIAGLYGGTAVLVHRDVAIAVDSRKVRVLGQRCPVARANRAEVLPPVKHEVLDDEPPPWGEAWQALAYATDPRVVAGVKQHAELGSIYVLNFAHLRAI